MKKCDKSVVSSMLFFFSLFIRSDAETGFTFNMLAHPEPDASWMPICTGEDDLGRKLPMPGNRTLPAAYKDNKKTGIFYFVWHGLNGTPGPYDNSKIIKQYLDALFNTSRWGPLNEYHWWGESLFGYFLATDEWVLRRDVMMLTDAGYDFIIIDESNDSFYPQGTRKLLKILNEYRQQGWKVPQAAFITKGNSGKWMNVIHDTYYVNDADIGDAGNAAQSADNRSHNSSVGDGYGAVNYKYQIAKQEVSVGEWEEFSNDPNNGRIGNYSSNYDYWAESAAGLAAPVSYVSFNDAAQYCNWLTTGNATNGAYSIRLSDGAVTNIMSRAEILAGGCACYLIPTADEWYKAACYDPDTGEYFAYANGSNIPPDDTNACFEKSHPWPFYQGTAEQNGTYNMMGNIGEWVEDLDGVRYGGNYGDYIVTCSGSRNENAYPWQRLLNTGFRIVKISAANNESLWFQLDGKPLIIGNNTSVDLRDDVKNYFTIRYAQWPREANREDGFPWISFERPQHLHGNTLGTSIMSVSIAQHSGSFAFSTSAFYHDPNNWTRSFRNGNNDPAPDAYLYGYNFAEQFQNAMDADADIVFITGWNEWIARRFSYNVISNDPDYPYQGPIWFIDQADANNSRDIQPMKGGFGDNYYMQAIALNRKFKGVSPRNTELDKAFTCANKTIDINGSFAQWDSIDNLYLDWANDTAHRNAPGYGDLVYTNTTGRNDLTRMKVTHDETHLYFYVETSEDITPSSGAHWMNLFINTGNSFDTWNGYDFVVNRCPTVIEKCTGNWNWEKADDILIRTENKKMQLAVPFDVLGISSGKDFSLQFKWADNVQGEGDIWSFYLDGDSAPYGRLNYIYVGHR